LRLWFAPNSEVPLYRQLVTQIQLAILSGDLRPGERLPSTRELARRYDIHPNTISAGYRELQRDGLADLRPGSGVYVRKSVDAPSTPKQVLDRHIAAFFRAARELQLPQADVRSRVAHWLSSPPPDHLLVIDHSPELRRILISEIRRLTSFDVREASLDECADRARLKGGIGVCRPSETKQIRAMLPPGMELITLHITSAIGWLTPRLPAAEGHLVAVVSHWDEFLIHARPMLAATGLPAESLIFRDARLPQWRRGLDQAAGLLCDSYTASLPTLPRKPRTIVFPLIAEPSRDMLRRYAADSAIL
jgi:DNA-binding transcriptional regulator YhcF (GntR family)